MQKIIHEYKKIKQKFMGKKKENLEDFMNI